MVLNIADIEAFGVQGQSIGFLFLLSQKLTGLLIVP
jgi:hypothetical protein